MTIRRLPFSQAEMWFDGQLPNPQIQEFSFETNLLNCSKKKTNAEEWARIGRTFKSELLSEVNVLLWFESSLYLCLIG